MISVLRLITRVSLGNYLSCVIWELVVLFLNFIIGFLSGKLQRIVVDCMLTGDVRVSSVFSQGSGLSHVLFLLHTSDLSMNLDSTLVP